MKQNNPSVIGLFVIGGAILLMTAIALFSSPDFFTPKRQFVVYFQQSVNGLNVGAPVQFRGIPVGQVIKIEGIYDPQTGNMIPRLMIEFRPETLENAVVQEGEYTLFPVLLANGLRASLKSASLLTGQLFVSLDFQPNTDERYLGGGNDDVPEMPSLDSGFDEALAKLSELPLQEVLLRVSGALSAAEELMRNPDLAASLQELPALLGHTDEAVVAVQGFVNGDLSIVAQDTSAMLASTSKSIEDISETLSTETLLQLSEVLSRATETLQLAKTRLDPNDPVTIELLVTLRNLSGMARSFRELADAIEEQPESLLRGKSSK